MLITTILLITGVGNVISSFDVYPLNKVVLAGQSMDLECRVNHNETVNRWTATRLGLKTEVIFEISGNSRLTTYFDVWSRENGDCILHLNRTELTDAGLYTCYKNYDAVQTSAQLIVLESIPVCESKISLAYHSLSAGNYIWMQCSVNVSTVTNWSPIMEWTQLHEGVRLLRSESVTLTTNSTVTSVLNVSFSLQENGSYFSCITFFKPYNGTVKVTASNIPDFRFIWNSSEINFQECSLPTDKDVAMSSNGMMDPVVTTTPSDQTSAGSATNNWFALSISLVVVVSIFLILMTIMALGFYHYRKRIAAGGVDAVQAKSLASLDQPMPNDYDMIDFKYEDEYDNIEDTKVTDIKVPTKVSRPKVSLPTFGYESLLQQRGVPGIYASIDDGEQSLDKVDKTISTENIPESE